jgi:hypothetical protein
LPTNNPEIDMTQYAKFQTRSAWLGTEFGESYARKLFGDAAVDALPRYTRGKNVGKFKAEIAWVKCLQGGWISTGAAICGVPSGRVENRSDSTVFAALRQDGNPVAVHGDIKYASMLGV